MTRPANAAQLADMIKKAIEDSFEAIIAVGDEFDEVGLEIVPDTLEPNVISLEEAEESGSDVYPLLDLLAFDTDGIPHPDDNIIRELAAQYL